MSGGSRRVRGFPLLSGAPRDADVQELFVVVRGQTVSGEYRRRGVDQSEEEGRLVGVGPVGGEREERPAAVIVGQEARFASADPDPDVAGRGVVAGEVFSGGFLDGLAQFGEEGMALCVDD